MQSLFLCELHNDPCLIKIPNSVICWREERHSFFLHVPNLHNYNYILRCPTDVSAVNGASLELVSERKRKSANDYKKMNGDYCSHVVNYVASSYASLPRLSHFSLSLIHWLGAVLCKAKHFTLHFCLLLIELIWLWQKQLWYTSRQPIQWYLAEYKHFLTAIPK